MVEEQQDMEFTSKSGYPGVTEPPFRLNVKRNFKGDYGFEYTVKGDNIREVKLNDYEMQKYLFSQGLVSKEPKFPESK